MDSQLSFLPKIEKSKIQERCYNSLYTEMISESLEALKQAHKFSVLKEFNAFLMSTLPQRSPITRDRNANKIIDRYIGDKNMNSPLIKLFRKIEETTVLEELLYFHFLNREKIVNDFVGDVLFKNLNSGCLNKEAVGAYVLLALGREDRDTSRRMVRTLCKFGIIKKEKNRLLFSCSRPHFPSFLYILHYEFSKPGLYSHEKVVNSNLRKIYLVSDKDLEDLITEAWNEKYIGYSLRGDSGIEIRHSLEEIGERIIKEVRGTG
jgi:hypothetical protein